MKVRDLLAKADRPPVTISAEKTVGEAMKLLTDHKIGSLIVIDSEGNPAGIITERDIFRIAYKYHGEMMQMKVADHMTSNLIIGLPDDDIDYIAKVITQNRIRHIPIMDKDEKLAGIISIGDIVKAKLDMAEVELRYLTEYITGHSKRKHS